MVWKLTFLGDLSLQMLTPKNKNLFCFIANKEPFIFHNAKNILTNFIPKKHFFSRKRLINLLEISHGC